MVTDLYTISEEIRKCTSCKLWKERMLAVPGEGSQNSKVMMIIGFPTNEDDRLGHPFDKNTDKGKKFEQMLIKLKLTRDQMFVTNLIKCFPRKEKVTSKEIKTCGDKWLSNQIKLIKPELIILSGEIVFKNIIGNGNFKKNIGKELIEKKQRYLIVEDF